MKYSTKLLELRRQFDGTKYDNLVNEYINAFIKGNKESMDKVIGKFPTEVQLLETLLKKLKGKSVETNIRKVFRDEKINKVDTEIALSSFYTHICIEMKQGNTEYKNLKKDVLNKLNNI